ncbi:MULTISPECIES: hypothetical protein [Haloferax]|uniref:Small CPxCG-related zinc finger protein n=1 Tax=Haloferax massiliensis TaxID=1476858 RepID=A0A0D6JSF7_9EURY|nr:MULTISPECIES: hypothetical protein [Haloferax]MDS0240405.1 hypothetical protein [Haloferax sp. S2CR25]MDS0443526.1 hypothetical protein [Haloferax sp. S2CR25-2]CQR50525.1 hypothetical protein BN996_02007 [Haloferax massiliensis]
MSFEWVSYFTCEECGLERPSPEVPYDRLGYAICPNCGAETRPAAPVTADASTLADG